MNQPKSGAAQEPAKPETKRVAVIVVHGVGDHLPGSSARQISDLLANLKPSGAVASCTTKQPAQAYSSFAEEVIAVAVEPVKIVAPDAIGVQAKADNPRKPRGGVSGPFAALAKDARTSGKSPHAPEDQQDHCFMRAQLLDYKVQYAEKTYRSIRLKGTRRGSTGLETKVDVYELYWKDLSSVGLGVATIFGQLYQILFHITSLGCQAVRGTLMENPGVRAWSVFNTLQTWTSLTLSVLIVIANLFLLGVAVELGVCFLIFQQSDRVQLFLGLILSLIALLIFVGRMFLSRHRTLNYKLWNAPIVIFAAALIPVALLATRWWITPGLSFVTRSASIMQGVIVPSLLLMVIAVVFAKIVVAYDKQRPGVARLAKILGGLLVPAIVVWLFIPPAGYISGTYAAGNLRNFSALAVLEETGIFLRSVLELAWLSFFGLLFCSHIFGWFAVSQIPPEDGKQVRATLSRWTARFTNSLSGLAVYLVTFVMWMLVTYGLSRLRPDGFKFLESPDKTLTALLLQQNGFGICALFLALTILVLVFDAWSLAPSAWSELFPPKNSDDRDKADRESEAMGSWMTNGNSLIRLAGRLLYSVLFFVFPLDLVSRLSVFDSWKILGGDGTLLTKLTLGLIGGATGLLALRGEFTKLALGFRPALSIVLDVDNYFREHPLDSNPRARIAARFVSLIRHLCTLREHDTGKGYDAIVIVAHSQGSAVVADLLRFIRIERSVSDEHCFRSYDSKLRRLDEDLPVHLFTMGSPLRQYYARLFPDLYKWVRSEINAASPTNPGDVLPDPQSAGLASWTNAFRSGDYIGRQLWCDNSFDKLFSIPTSAQLQGSAPSPSCANRKEFCIGRGAHIHYWDSTAGLIAIELDRIIAESVTHPFSTVIASQSHVGRELS